jgi:glutathione S-transferase
MEAPFTLYGTHLSGPTYKVALMLALCERDFVYRHVDFDCLDHQQPDFLAINRFGQGPALSHRGLTLCEAGAILEYLADLVGKFDGADTKTAARVREWLFWDTESLSPGIYRSRAFKRETTKTALPIVEYFRRAGESGLTVLNNNLVAGAFLVGDAPTIADIACYGAVVYAPEAGYDLARWPKVISWMCRITELPHFRRPQSLLPLEDAA